MAKKPGVKAAPKRKVAFTFDEIPEGKTHLRVRNITPQIVAIPTATPSALDLFLLPQGEVSVEPPAWIKNRNMRSAYKQELVELEWVGEEYVPRPIPSVTSAPAAFMPENAIDQAYVMQICFQTDLQKTYALINHQVDAPETAETDVTFMKTRMHKILKTAEWVEAQLQNRKSVLETLKERLAWIRSL